MAETDVPPVAFPMGGENKGDTFIDCYMCMVDWGCELGCAAGGNKVYASVEDLKESRACVEGCGIVKVRVQFLEVIDAGKDQ